MISVALAWGVLVEKLTMTAVEIDWISCRIISRCNNRAYRLVRAFSRELKASIARVARTDLGLQRIVHRIQTRQRIRRYVYLRVGYSPVHHTSVRDWFGYKQFNVNQIRDYTSYN